MISRDKIVFETLLPPSANTYLGKRIDYSNGKPMIKIYETQQAKEYKTMVKKVVNRAIKEQNWETPDENTYIICSIVIYKSQKHRDADNMFKCLLDAIKDTGIIYDDCMIIPRVENVFIDSNFPRLKVTLSKSEKKGIFDNEIIFNEFVDNNCFSCTRYSRNCSILRKCLENRIIFEVDIKNMKCKSIKQKK